MNTYKEELPEPEVRPQVDTAASCYQLAASYLGVPVSDAELGEALGGRRADFVLLKEAARRHKFKGEVVRKTVADLHGTPIPAIARMQDDTYVVVGWNDERNVFISDPLRDRPYAQSLEEFGQRWTGELLVFTTAFDWRRIVKRYNLDWFYSIIVRYKPYWRDVFVASLFLQLFGLAVPLMTQVVVDKVLGNNGLSTLDVLGAALIVFSFFQCGMGILRTYFLTHTTNCQRRNQFDLMEVRTKSWTLNETGGCPCIQGKNE